MVKFRTYRVRKFLKQIKNKTLICLPQTLGQPVVVQVSSGGQFIAVAVSPEAAGQAANSQQSGVLIITINLLLGSSHKSSLY